MNMTELKDHMDHAIMKTMDHKNLDKDVDFFQWQVKQIDFVKITYRNFKFSLFNLQPSTTENVAVYIWQTLKNRMTRPELLYEVKIQETDKNCVIYRGRLSGGNYTFRGQGCEVSSDSDQINFVCVFFYNNDQL